MGQEESEGHRAKYDPSTRPRHAVLTTLAEAVDADPTELEVTLYDIVELEAFDTLLLHRPENDTSVTFTFEEMQITAWLDEDRHVIVVIESLPE